MGYITSFRSQISQSSHLSGPSAIPVVVASALLSARPAPVFIFGAGQVACSSIPKNFAGEGFGFSLQLKQKRLSALKHEERQTSMTTEI